MYLIKEAVTDREAARCCQLRVQLCSISLQLFCRLTKKRLKPRNRFRVEAKEGAVLSRVQGRVETEKPRSQKTGGKNIWSNEGKQQRRNRQ